MEEVIMHRKVLILSHNPIGNTDNMGKTMQNIFSCFPKEELCQLYIRNQEPSFNTCKEYFYIDEVQMIKSIFNKKTDTGLCCGGTEASRRAPRRY